MVFRVMSRTYGGVMCRNLTNTTWLLNGISPNFFSFVLNLGKNSVMAFRMVFTLQKHTNGLTVEVMNATVSAQL